MKGYIAFCPHFHQPHFQLYKTREEAYLNSYQPWLKLLGEAVSLDKFFINLHFSGPFLYWFRDQKQDYLKNLKNLLGSGKIGIVGGFADEPFIQLSSRFDDYLYQLKEYDRLAHELFGVTAPEWQGIHLVERECGETLLAETSRAAGLLGAKPIYYLDAETFYLPHFAKPGGAADFCLKHFGFKDPFSFTTIAHLPSEIMYFALRDEIQGQEFTAVPVHTEYRYRLLKRNAFIPGDRIKVKPAHYLFYIKDALENACNLAAQYGREIKPVVLVFEDAEKMGQWSKDPQGDADWLMEFFRLVEQDDEVSFIGLRDYVEKVGFLDTYPVSSSHSYPEWENWTAKRGIRGVAFGDERLRRVMSRLRLLEEAQENFEKTVIEAHSADQFAGAMQEMVTRSILQSPERFEMVQTLLTQNYEIMFSEYYALINRVRNLLYQEDPKWASRHPCYGSSPYYDMQGLAYLELSDRLLMHLQSHLSGKPVEPDAILIKDWDFDGRDEILILNPQQTLAIDLEGGCVHYHHVLSAPLDGDHRHIAEILRRDFKEIKAYHSVYRYSCPLVMTETDSSMQTEFFPQGARRENCRNSLRCELLHFSDGEYTSLGNLEQASYNLDEVRTELDHSRVSLSCEQTVIYKEIVCTVTIRKHFLIFADRLQVIMKVNMDEKLADCFLVPQIVTSAAPSDEVAFCPVAWLGFNAPPGNSSITVQDIIAPEMEDAGLIDQQIDVSTLTATDYIYLINSGDGNRFAGRISYQFLGDAIEKMEVQPAVKYYYKDLVFAEQSRLGYQSSGIMLQPFIPVQDGEAEFIVDITWQLDCLDKEEEYQQVVQLIKR
ncbi:Glycoside hydrolase/deacetylase, beta/alpha-barrel [Syntrophomonas zehnderi OL-4]|uniref:Glycoside hydrolase/deacetylase, beta/alpha-barrel n=1 Tax=Syntrophomonas zehnderi OL-4 TaxID=690567 RepID=A0A0E4G972_9FIRM|nr:hypothetical protein [Syntrophomonas zehnderi]CFW97598.1 Glycoside hydrolase/deacetylase, beta/alpha-barrel [Syntrophomonas zehnderi OL-4]